jgi:transcriptional regulator with XRE-family HTH domain
MNDDIKIIYSPTYFSDLIKNKRKKMGMTQEDVAKITNIPRSRINQIELEKKDIKLSDVIKIFEALKLRLGGFSFE